MFAILINLGLFVWGIFNNWGYYIYLIIYTFLFLIMYILSKTKINKEDFDFFNRIDLVLLEEFYFAIRYPIGSKMLSKALNSFRMTGILWIILSIIMANYLFIIAPILLYILSGYTANKYDPFTLFRTGDPITTSINAVFPIDKNRLKIVYDKYWEAVKNRDK